MYKRDCRRSKNAPGRTAAHGLRYGRLCPRKNDGWAVKNSIVWVRYSETKTMYSFVCLQQSTIVNGTASKL